MQENTKIKCPFRKDKDGDFKECYKEKCMAYFDMKQYSMHPESCQESPVCIMLVKNPITSYSCA